MFGSIKEKITQYIEVYVSLLKVNVIGHTSKLMGYVLFAMICLLIFFCTLIFSGFAIVEGFAALGMHRGWAFLATLAFYVFLLLGIISSRKSIIRSFANAIIKVLTEDMEEPTNK